MNRPTGFAPMEKYAHGTRAKYVTGCRCDACKASNAAYYHQRQARAKELAAELPPAPEKAAPQRWTAPDGTVRERVYKRACPGVKGKPCPLGAHLRKDSKGGCCRACRKLLVWNGLVSAELARAHLAELSKVGVGYKAVADACDVAHSILQRVAAGSKKKIRADTERKILSVDKGAAADGARIPARETWADIRALLRLGYSKAELARRLGYSAPALPLRKGQVLARNAHLVKKLRAEIMAELEAEKALPKICPDCGYSHAQEDRMRAIRSHVGELGPKEIASLWSCFYGDGESGARRVHRDLVKLRELGGRPIGTA